MTMLQAETEADAAALAAPAVGAPLVLLDRLVPGTNMRIDRLVVGSATVQVVGLLGPADLVERRNGRVGAERGPQLYVGGENRTSLVVDVQWQVASVRHCLERAGLAVVADVHAVLRCDGVLASGEFEIDGVRVVGSDVVLGCEGSAGPDEIARVASELTRGFPSL